MTTFAIFAMSIFPLLLLTTIEPEIYWRQRRHVMMRNLIKINPGANLSMQVMRRLHRHNLTVTGFIFLSVHPTQPGIKTSFFIFKTRVIIEVFYKDTVQRWVCVRQSSCSASYMLLSILFLFFCILKAGWDTKKQIEREKEREKE